MGKSDKKQSKDSKKTAVKVPKSSKEILADAKVRVKPAVPAKDAPKKVKKVETKKPVAKASSSEESSESSSEDEKPKASLVKVAKKAASSSSDDSSDSESEAEKPKPAPKPTPSKAPVAASSSSSSDSDSESSDEEEVPVVKSKVAPKVEEKKPIAKSKKTTKVEEKKPATSSDSSDSSDSEEETTKKSSSSDSESSDGSEDDDGDVKMTEVKANGASKRKADDDDQPAAKKVKLANGAAAAAAAPAPAAESGEETKAIFVGQLSWSIDNDRLAQEFADCGEVESATVQTDRNTGKSRGFGYVHFTTTEAVEKALLMNGQEIDGRAIKVDRSAPRDATKDRAKRAQAFGDTPSAPSATLFVGNLSFNASEDSVWGLFGDYGVKSVRLPTDRETGRPKGFGYVEFEDIDGAKKAFESLNGSDFEGRGIRLDYSQPRDSSAGGFGGGRGGSRGGFGGDRGRGGSRGGRGGFDRGGGGRGGRGGGFDRGGRGGGGRGGPPRKNGGITPFEGKKTTF